MRDTLPSHKAQLWAIPTMNDSFAHFYDQLVKGGIIPQLNYRDSGCFDVCKIFTHPVKHLRIVQPPMGGTAIG